MLVMDKRPQIPFIFGRIVSGYSFVNRVHELERLTANLRSGLNTILISPRRWGKSSLVMKAADEIIAGNEKTKICKLDLFNIRSEKEFYESFVKEILKATSNKWEDWILNGKGFLKNIVPRFSVGTDPLHDFSVSFDLKPTQKSIVEILMLPEKIAQSKKLRIIVCIDEFQNLSFYEKPLEFQKQLRACWQTHKHVCYCLYGSKRHMITNLFENKSMPFYKFGDLMLLERISEGHWVEYIIKAFKRTSKAINAQAASAVASAVQNHPYFVQQLAQKTWIKTNTMATEDTVNSALDDLVHENAILYLREVENLTNTQVSFLQAIIERTVQLSSAETIKKYNLGTSANVLRIKSALEQKEVLDFFGHYPEFIDPVFELWLKKIYFK
jgi:hypothetical protein